MGCTIQRTIGAGSAWGSNHDTANVRWNPSDAGGGRWARGRNPQAHAVLITADGGGSNARRNRLWKVELQKLADEIGIAIYVRHFPPGTRKWNTILTFPYRDFSEYACGLADGTT